MRTVLDFKKASDEAGCAGNEEDVRSDLILTGMVKIYRRMNG
jgi:hypothetical protein